MKILGVPLKRQQLFLFFGDFLCLLAAVVLGHLFRFGTTGWADELLARPAEDIGPGLLFLASTYLGLYLADAYSPSADFRRLPENIRLWSAVLSAFLFRMLVFALFPYDGWGRGLSFFIALTAGAMLTTWRALLSQYLPPPVSPVNTLIVGAGQGAHLIARVIREEHEIDRTYNVLGFVDHNRGGNRRRTDFPDDAALEVDGAPPILGNETNLVELLDKQRVELIVVAIRGNMSDELTARLLECKARGVRIERMATVYKRLLGKVPVLHLPEAWVIFSPVFSDTSPFTASLERLADILVACVGLAISAPIIAVAAVLIKLESPGPAIFVQERLGLNEKPFKIFKLRTMRQDAEAKTGAVWSQGASDPRVTRVGRFLRRTRIDELPQFWNVLIGDMAVIGPRPEREPFVGRLKQKIPFYSMRFSVKPGLTGWAQVRYRYGATDEDAAEKLCYELYAIQDLTPMLYAVILLNTVRTVLLKPGS